MITPLHDADRGRTRQAWLDSAHSFSFGDFYEPGRTGFGVMRVLNEDRVQPGRGFPSHGHANMEILSWVVSGELLHRDSTGSESRLPAGSMQLMSAGAGIRHSEHNASSSDALHFLQIWLQPDRVNGAPAWNQRRFEDAELRNRLCLLASPDPRDDALPLRQSARVYAARLDRDRIIETTLGERRRAWLQLVRGAIDFNGHSLRAGDGASVVQLHDLRIAACADEVELLLFDLP